MHRTLPGNAKYQQVPSRRLRLRLLGKRLSSIHALDWDKIAQFVHWVAPLRTEYYTFEEHATGADYCEQIYCITYSRLGALQYAEEKCRDSVISQKLEQRLPSLNERVFQHELRSPSLPCIQERPLGRQLPTGSMARPNTDVIHDNESSRSAKALEIYQIRHGQAYEVKKRLGTYMALHFTEELGEARDSIMHPASVPLHHTNSWATFTSRGSQFEGTCRRSPST